MLKMYIDLFPLTPLGGAFVLPVGICIVLGAILPGLRLPLVGIGFALGLVLVELAARPLSAGVPPAPRVAVYSLVLAIAVEIVAFAVVMPRERAKGTRAAGLSSLLIVGFHFLIMTPAFGPLILLLGALAIANAWRAQRRPDLDFRGVWALDGVLKIGFATAMLGTAPALH